MYRNGNIFGVSYYMKYIIKINFIFLKNVVKIPYVACIIRWCCVRTCCFSQQEKLKKLMNVNVQMR